MLFLVGTAYNLDSADKRHEIQAASHSHTLGSVAEASFKLYCAGPDASWERRGGLPPRREE